MVWKPPDRFSKPSPPLKCSCSPLIMTTRMSPRRLRPARPVFYSNKPPPTRYAGQFGKSNKETASELGIGIKTVEKHREHLMAKLDIHDTAGLTRYAISAGIIESSVQLTIV